MARLIADMAMLLLAVTAQAQAQTTAPAPVPPPTDVVGDQFEIRRVVDTTYSQGDMGSGNSHDEDRIVERVIAVTDAGVELDYDLVPSATAEERAASWQFPARVLRSNDGPLQLLNATELAARVDGWLTSGGMTRANCGRWIFTWNAFRIDCDPQSVLATIDAFALTPAVPRAGLLYRDPAALAAMPLTVRESANGRTTYMVELAIDPEVVRRARAENDAVAAEIMGPQAAARPQTTITDVTGTIRVTFETDGAGRLQRRTSVTEMEITLSDGVHETRTATATLERRRIEP